MTRITLPTGALIALLTHAPAPAWAHGDPVLCDTRQAVATQCGGAHSSLVDPDVDLHIGICEGDFEEGEAFVVCDRRREQETCPPGKVCRISHLDPYIGACVVDAFAGFEPEPEPEPEQEEEAGCLGASGEPLTGTYLGIVMLGMLGWRRRPGGDPT